MFDVTMQTARGAMLNCSLEGICLDCGEFQDGVESDVSTDEPYTCEDCYAVAVVGIGFAVESGMVTIDGNEVC